MGGTGRKQQSHVGISGMANNLFRKFSLSVPFAIKQKRYKSQNFEKKKPFAVTNGNVYLALHSRILNCLKWIVCIN